MPWNQLELFEAPASFVSTTLKYKKQKHFKNRLIHKYRQLEFDFNPALSDKELFLKLQKQYKAGDSSSLNDMYKLIYKIAFRMILKQQEAKGFNICQLDKEIKAYNCASYIIEQYLKRPDFSITEIGGYIFCRVRHELYYRTKLDDLLKNVGKVEPEKYFADDYIYQEE